MSTPAGTSEQNDSPSADTVIVPDVLAAIREHEFATSYESDPEAVAAELTSFATGVIEGAGLEAEVNLQPITIPDSQEPAAGSEVAKGSVVTVNIGFGD